MSILPEAGAHHVSVLFPGVKNAAQEAAVRELRARAAWPNSPVVWTAVAAQERFPAETGADFSAPTLFPNGQFPLEAFVLAFRRWGGVNILVAEGPAFHYTGQPRYDTPDVAIDATPGPTSLALRIYVKNPNLERLVLPAPLTQQPGHPAPRRMKRRAPVFLWVLLALAAAGLAWLAVYATLLPRATKQTAGEERSPPRRRTK